MAGITIIPAGRGTRHTNSWAAGQRPINPREGMTFFWPNGMPLTAMLGMMKSKKPKDPEFSHYCKYLPYQASDHSGVFTAQTMVAGVAYAAGVNAAGTVLYVKVPLAMAQETRVNHLALLRDKSMPMNDTPCEVVDVIENAANSCIVVKTLCATTAAPAAGVLGRDPSTSDRIFIYGNAQEQGSVIPDEVNYNPTKYENYCQIFWTPYSITGTMQETELRTGDATKEEKREKLQMHGLEMEKNFLLGYKRKTTVRGKDKYYTQGLLEMIREHVPSQELDWRADAAYSGQDFEVGGKKWLETQLEIISRIGPMERVGFCGSLARLGLSAMAENYRNITITQNEAEFGFKVDTINVGPLKLHLKTHPVMSWEETYRNSMFIFDPGSLTEYALRNTRKTKDNDTHTDGTKEGWLTETGLHFSTPATAMALHGIGLQNTA